MLFALRPLQMVVQPFLFPLRDAVFGQQIMKIRFGQMFQKRRVNFDAVAQFFHHAPGFRRNDLFFDTEFDDSVQANHSHGQHPVAHVHLHLHPLTPSTVKFSPPPAGQNLDCAVWTNRAGTKPASRRDDLAAGSGLCMP